MPFKNVIERQSAFNLFQSVLPKDHSRQVTAADLARVGVRQLPERAKVLDLGCGEGNSIDLFKRLAPEAVWHGVDIGDSPEVRSRTLQDANFATFDGTNLPYESDFFDLLYSRQVLEHVRAPDALLRDAVRVLKPGGIFVGSVAYLEPYHSFSIFNFTPYGVMRTFQDAGLEVLELRPGVDAPSLILRQALLGPRIFKPLFRWSPMNGVVGLLGRVTGLQHQHINFLKLQFTGHIGFVARRTGSTA